MVLGIKLEGTGSGGFFFPFTRTVEDSLTYRLPKTGLICDAFEGGAEEAKPEAWNLGEDGRMPRWRRPARAQCGTVRCQSSATISSAGKATVRSAVSEKGEERGGRRERRVSLRR